MSKGDHIYVVCGAYTHHGIDCGDGRVIHYTKSSGSGIIARNSLSAFASGKPILARKYDKCDSPNVVMQRAEERLGEVAYDLLFNNCEHFATWCKTGIHKSEQVKNAGAVAGGASGSGAAVAGSLGVVSAAGAAAGLSGAGIMSGLATVGGVVGGGAVAGIGALGMAPAAITTLAMNKVLEDDEDFTSEEREARAVGRTMTTVGAAAGTAGAVSAVAAFGSVAGLSGAGITSGLAAIGSTVGLGMAGGVAITVAAPAVAAAAVGFSAYQIWKWISE
ncbi:lecithin retinol acyltransferase family protein [Nostoc sp. 'Peltigera membranacea cyanobiont' N6]|uniref:lecithin retinol acyltransferase family protein n=1 Tax=Nostoc sp. 'Peltigera membranacea cyanobiont' N6 TaxID=1261031 RepID=UPI000CF32FB3|nr:lecithin retinol acyltransferase family protein [Nostoc sp. 'Peltigera membranacea cyanobiont' N6]AVH68453.1 LRAT domain-containing protein [Nostoc sp. 'Peltigera membranacea cyanobiont' N6]